MRVRLSWLFDNRVFTEDFSLLTDDTPLGHICETGEIRPVSLDDLLDRFPEHVLLDDDGTIVGIRTKSVISIDRLEEE
jgi:acetoacetate decarboxylase